MKQVRSLQTGGLMIDAFSRSVIATAPMVQIESERGFFAQAVPTANSQGALSVDYCGGVDKVGPKIKHETLFWREIKSLKIRQDQPQ